MTEQEIIDSFHRLWYSKAKHGGTWDAVTWMGAKAWKTPMDLWIYQEILWERKPDVIVECGTMKGGTALFLAQMCHLMGSGRVITIDLEHRPANPTHGRLTYLTGSSIDPKMVEGVKGYIEGGSAMVILDSDHTRDHVIREMELYGPLVTPGNYLIVEDGNINGHPITEVMCPGPTEAIEIFLRTHPEFEIDRLKEKFLLSFNPGGYLRKK